MFDNADVDISITPRKIKLDFRKLGYLKNDLYYYRDIDKKEIDLLIVDANCIYPIEIKKSKEPNKPDANLRALDKFSMEIKPELVICMSEEVVPYNRKCYLVPVAII